MFRARSNVGNDIYGVKRDWQLQERLGESAETGFRHSDHYHQYFHGYTEVRIERPNGRYRIERYYTADWYVQDCTDRQWIGQKIAMSALGLLTVLAYVWLMTRPAYEGNTSRLAAVPGLLVVPFLVLLTGSVIGYAATGRKMTWWEHHAGTGRISRYSLIVGSLMLLTGVAMLVQVALGVANPGSEILHAIAVMATALLPFAMYLLEHRMPYTTQHNEVELPPGEPHLIG